MRKNAYEALSPFTTLNDVWLAAIGTIFFIVFGLLGLLMVPVLLCVHQLISRYKIFYVDDVLVDAFGRQAVLDYLWKDIKKPYTVGEWIRIKIYWFYSRPHPSCRVRKLKEVKKL